MLSHQKTAVAECLRFLQSFLLIDIPSSAVPMYVRTCMTLIIYMRSYLKTVARRLRFLQFLKSISLEVASHMLSHVTAEWLAQRDTRPVGGPLAEPVVEVAKDPRALISAQILAGHIADGHVTGAVVLGYHDVPSSGCFQHVLVLDALLDAELLCAVRALGVVEWMPVEEDGVRVDVVHSHAAVAPCLRVRGMGGVVLRKAEAG